MATQSINNIIAWICRLAAAAILLQTLFFKFSGAEESVYIFSKVGIEPWGRYLSGIAELIAAVLILIPRTSGIGALLACMIMAGAIASHLFILGIEVMGDHGQLFIYACIVMLASLYLVFINRAKLLRFIRKGSIGL